MTMPDSDNFTADKLTASTMYAVSSSVKFAASSSTFHPSISKAVGKFIGRIWVEDREMNIVRFNGTYTHSSAAHLYFHFDSWRVNVASGEWVPAFIYVEESKPSTTAPKFPRFKAQTRLWGYNTPKNGQLEELTSIAIETEKDLKDHAVSEKHTAREPALLGASGGNEHHRAP